MEKNRIKNTEDNNNITNQQEHIENKSRGIY